MLFRNIVLAATAAAALHAGAAGRADAVAGVRIDDSF